MSKTTNGPGRPKNAESSMVIKTSKEAKKPLGKGAEYEMCKPNGAVFMVFIESFDNPVVAMKSKIKQAVSYQIIKTDSDAIKWFDTNKYIISVPVGQDPVDVFVRYCMTEAAAPVVGEIERQLG
jgi:hypothetical protein